MNRIRLSFMPLALGFLGFFIFLYFNAYGANGNIDIEIYALRHFQDNGIKIENKTSDDIYKTNPASTVASSTLFRIKLKNAGTSIISLTINGYSTSGNCQNIGGYISGNDCIIEGMFTNPGENYRIVNIQYKVNDKTTSTSFFVVRSPDTGTQYLIEPQSTTTQPTSTITYTIYSNKAYCTKDLPSQISFFATPTPTIGSISRNTIAGQITHSVNSDVIFSGVQSGTYYLYLVSNNQQVSNISTVKIGIPQLRCFLGFCQYYDTTRGRWVNTSTDVCRNNNLICTPGAIRE